MTTPILMFLILATATIAGAVITLWSRYIVHSVFGLMLSLFGVAGFYVLLGSDFLAVTQIIVYVGGVVVLYLFGVMLTPPDMSERSGSRILLTAVPAVAALIFFLIAASGMQPIWTGLQPEGGMPQEGQLIEEIGISFMHKDQYLLAFELASVLLLVALVGAVFIARRRVLGKSDAQGGLAK